MSNQLYPSDVTDREWEMIAPLIPVAKTGGRCRTTEIRKGLDGIFYVDRGGSAWRYLPREYPPWQTVYGSFRAWRLEGTWERLHAALRSAVRKREERASQPPAASMDSQSVKTTTQGGPERGDDAGKKVTGRKRPILVDTIGLRLVVVVHAAGRSWYCRRSCTALCTCGSSGPMAAPAARCSTGCARCGLAIRYTSRSSNAATTSQASSYCRGDGSWSAPSRGLACLADSARTMKPYRRPARPSCGSP